MKVLILGGFLGSGKTTVIIELAKRIIERSDHELPVAILENEIGEVGVDDKLLSADGYSVRNMFSGCACCTLSGELVGALRSMKDDLDPEWVIIEPTGLAIPANVAKTLEDYAEVSVRIVTLADAKRWKRMERAMANLLENQLEAASVILVNKSDLVDAGELAYVCDEGVRAFNKDATVIPIVAKDGLDEETVDLILGEAE